MTNLINSSLFLSSIALMTYLSIKENATVKAPNKVCTIERRAILPLQPLILELINPSVSLFLIYYNLTFGKCFCVDFCYMTNSLSKSVIDL